jgi:hypothetical protein
MGRSLLIDLWTAIIGLGIAGLILHNSGAAEGEARYGFSGFTGALTGAASTR